MLRVFDCPLAYIATAACSRVNQGDRVTFIPRGAFGYRPSAARVNDGSDQGTDIHDKREVFAPPSFRKDLSKHFLANRCKLTAIDKHLVLLFSHLAAPGMVQGACQAFYAVDEGIAWQLKVSVYCAAPRLWHHAQ